MVSIPSYAAGSMELSPRRPSPSSQIRNGSHSTEICNHIPLETLVYKKIAEKLEGMCFLPAVLTKLERRTYIDLTKPLEGINHTNVDSLIRLIYLSQLTQDHVSERISSPYPQSLYENFARTQKTGVWAHRGLTAGAAVTTALLLSTLVPVIPSVSTWAQEDPQNSLWLMIILMVPNTAANLINFVATGNFPYLSTSADTKSYFELQTSLQDYKDLSESLTDLMKKSPTLALEIAKKLDLKVLEKALERDFPSTSPLEASQIAHEHCKYLERVLEDMGDT